MLFCGLFGGDIYDIASRVGRGIAGCGIAEVVDEVCKLGGDGFIG
jgi:hypothetical protein